MTLHDLLQAGADDAIAIAAPGRTALDYRGLRALVAATTASLNAAGIGRNDRVAIVLPNGPEMATCFLACACAVTSAPLNPAYRGDEFEFYLDDLQAKALIVDRASASPAVEAAQQARRAGHRAERRRRRRSRPVQPRCRRRHTLRARWPRRGRRRGHGAAHLGHDLAAQAGAAVGGQSVRLGAADRGDAAIHAAGPRLEHHAAVPHPRPARRPAGAAVGRLAGVLHAGLQCAAILQVDGRGLPDLVHGRADDAPGDRQPRQAQRRGAGAPSAALRALVVVGDAAAVDRGDSKRCSRRR